MLRSILARHAALFCALTFLAALALAHPVAEMGFVDDWSYAKTAQVFAATGHFVYNGWATAMLGWQIAWGALWIRLFGFSFTVVKFSTIPIAVACLFLFHAVLRRFGAHPRNAVLGTLTLGLSPLFLPLTASFMTDVPGLFVLLLCFYCCKRALDAETDRAALIWLILAAAGNAAGGTVRQISWLGALVLLPSTGWLFRHRRGLFPAAVALWLAASASIFGFMHWFSQQPYSIPESVLGAFTLPDAPASGAGFLYFIRTLIMIHVLGGALCCLVLVALPIWIAGLPALRKIRKFEWVPLLCLFAGFVFLQIFTKNYLPWRTHVIDAMMKTSLDAFYKDQLDGLFLPVPIRLLGSALVFFSAAGMVYLLGSWLRQRGSGSLWRSSCFWFFAPYSLAHFFLLAPRAWNGAVLDRYLLGLFPVAILGAILLYQKQAAPSLPASSWITLMIFALFAIAGTHDMFAWQRARIQAFERVHQAGVPRDQIQGGFEFDGSTQLDESVTINDPRIQIPANAYHPVTGQRIPDRCGSAFNSYVPVVQPRYIVVFPAPRPDCFQPSEFPPVAYPAWIPPFRKSVWTERVP